MTIRTTRSIITFHAPFRFGSLEQMEPAGSYEVETDEEAIEGNDRTVYRRIATMLRIKSVGMTRTITVDPIELAAALARDALAYDGDRPAEPEVHATAAGVQGEYPWRSVPMWVPNARD